MFDGILEESGNELAAGMVCAMYSSCLYLTCSSPIAANASTTRFSSGVNPRSSVAVEDDGEEEEEYSEEDDDDGDLGCVMEFVGVTKAVTGENADGNDDAVAANATAAGTTRPKDDFMTGRGRRQVGTDDDRDNKCDDGALDLFNVIVCCERKWLWSR